MPDGEYIYIIAEAGINHGGNLDTARRMVEVASQAGVNAVKFQSFTAKGLTHDRLAADQHAFFRQYELSMDEHAELAAICKDSGVDFLSTPFDIQMANMLARLDVPAFKIASCDLTFLPLIEHCASFNKPLFISTGMGNIDEVKAAYSAAMAAGSPRVVMLQCTTNYPTAYADVNLRMMDSLRDEAHCPAGFSDHSIGNYACFAAAARGAEVIEKHFCLDKSVEGPDIPGSCSPVELCDLVAGIRAIEQSLGSAEKRMGLSETDVASVARRSIFYARDIKAGDTLSIEDLQFLRPATGLSPSRYGDFIGRVLTVDVKAGDPANPGDIALGPD